MEKMKMNEKQQNGALKCSDSTAKTCQYRKPEIFEISYAAVVYGASCLSAKGDTGELGCVPEDQTA